MTEQEWLAGTDPPSMLKFLKGKASDRKLRLFACACCRAIQHLFQDERSLQAVAVAERFTDARASEEERRIAFRVLLSAAKGGLLETVEATCLTMALDWPEPALLAALTAVKNETECLIDGMTGRIIYGAGGRGGDGIYRALGVCQFAARAAGYASQRRAEEKQGMIGGLWRAVTRRILRALDATSYLYGPYLQACEQEAKRHVAFLQDIFGNPFRPCPAVPPTVLTWNDGTVQRIAQGIYDERAFDRLPILADALEDAGCNNAEMLNHCRSDGHVLGCWLVDLVLGCS